MVNPNACNLSLGGQIEDQRMGCNEHVLFFDANPDELVDVEKPPKVDLLKPRLPENELVGLL